jgi:hypothetical protein
MGTLFQVEQKDPGCRRAYHNAGILLSFITPKLDLGLVDF